jgi:membrane protein required for colicin V production
MNLLDLIIIIPVVWLCIRGFSKGLIIELASLIGMVLGILAAWYFSGQVSDFLKGYFTLTDQSLKIISYIIIFLAVMLIVYLIGKAIESVVDMVMLGFVNKFLGAIFGLAKGIVLVGIVLFILESTGAADKIIKPETKEKSMFYRPIMQMVHFVMPGEKSAVGGQQSAVSGRRSPVGGRR